MSLEKIYIGLLSQAKARKEKFLTSYIVLLSHQPNSTGQSANWAGFYGACQPGPQKDNVGIQKIFLPCFQLSKKTKIYFFQRHVLHLPFRSLNSRCDLIALSSSTSEDWLASQTLLHTLLPLDVVWLHRQNGAFKYAYGPWLVTEYLQQIRLIFAR